MLKRVVIVLVILAACLPGAVRAQAGVALAAVEIDLWPEFDQPSMLVIYRLTLSPEVRLPVELGVRIPAAAGTPNAVAARQPDGALFNTPYTMQDDGDWTRLVFQATSPDLQIEYYDPTLSVQGETRHFEYRWPGDYAVAAFMVQVQQPVGASQMRFSPSLGVGETGADGMVYYTQQIGTLTQGQVFSISIDYDKTSDELSAGSVPVEASGPIDSGGTSRLTGTALLPWLLGLVGVILIVGGGLWYWQSGRQTAIPEARRAGRGQRKSPGGAGGAQSAPNGPVYCHQCGKRAAAGDRFCRACGTQLRIG
ncbi:MAG: zinc-ribbon domain-containing protein [Chloroflexota bacterium]